MQLTIELTPRQAARVLNQALRARAQLQIEPRNLPEGELLRGGLVGREGDLLLVELSDDPHALPVTVLIGAYCEIQMVLSGELYAFSTYVLDVTKTRSRTQSLMAVPEVIEVANRRRFERTAATVASQVRIWTATRQVPAVGLLANVSADGLACNIPGTELDADLALGDGLRVSFEIAGFDEIFELPAILCNKSLSPDGQQLALGMQFHVSPDDPVAQHTLQRIRAVLLKLTADPAEMDGEP